MAELVRDIANYIITNNIAKGLGNDIFLSFRPDEPDCLITLNEYPGDPIQFGVEAVQRRVQIVVREKDDAIGYKKIWSIFNLLSDPNDSIINMGTRWAVTQALQSPYRLEVDNKNRTIFVFNLSLTTSRDN